MTRHVWMRMGRCGRGISTVWLESDCLNDYTSSVLHGISYKSTFEQWKAVRIKRVIVEPFRDHHWSG